MSDYKLVEIHLNDTFFLNQIDALLQQEGLQRDANLDYICAICDEEYRPVCTGSLYKSTLRCFAVDAAHQGEGLLNQILSHLIQIQYERGYSHLFLYTKASTSKFFSDLGFYEIARVQELSFMENQKNGFLKYLQHLKQFTPPSNHVGAIVLNANPFTLGHQYLVEYAATNCEHLHLFIVSEDASLVPFSVRKKLVELGTSHLHNISIHDSGPYIISNATFPGYFLKDEEQRIKVQASLDVAIFILIADALHITKRFVGEEKNSVVTALYNQIMMQNLPESNIGCCVIPRKGVNGQAISASDVRALIKVGNIDAIRPLVPKSTYDFFQSDAAKPIIVAIQKEKNVIHY